MLSNITSINLSLQTQGAAFVARAISQLQDIMQAIGILPNFISTDVGSLPDSTGAVQGLTKGLYFTDTNTAQIVEWNGSAWVHVAPPIALASYVDGFNSAIYTGNNLKSWNAKVSKWAIDRSVNELSVVLMGDSWLGDGIAEPNDRTRFAYLMQDKLVRTFGYGGSGFFSTKVTSTGCSHYTSDETCFSYQVGTWTLSDEEPTSLGINASHIHSTDTSTPGKVVIDTKSENTQIDVWYYKVVGGGEFRWRVGSGSWTTVDTDDTAGLGVVEITGLSGGETIELEVVSAGTQGITFLGYQHKNANYKGVTVHRVANGGSEAVDYADVNATIWKAQLARLNPDLVIVCLQTNDQNANATPDNYLASMTTIITRIREVNADCDIILFSAVSGEDDVNLYPLEDYIAIQQRLAISNGLGFVKGIDLVGNYDEANANGLFTDVRHCNQYGSEIFTDAIVSQMIAVNEIPLPELSKERTGGIKLFGETGYLTTPLWRDSSKTDASSFAIGTSDYTLMTRVKAPDAIPTVSLMIMTLSGTLNAPAANINTRLSFRLASTGVLAFLTGVLTSNTATISISCFNRFLGGVVDIIAVRKNGKITIWINGLPQPYLVTSRTLAEFALSIPTEVASLAAYESQPLLPGFESTYYKTATYRRALTRSEILAWYNDESVDSTSLLYSYDLNRISGLVVEDESTNKFAGTIKGIYEKPFIDRKGRFTGKTTASGDFRFHRIDRPITNANIRIVSILAKATTPGTTVNIGDTLSGTEFASGVALATDTWVNITLTKNFSASGYVFVNVADAVTVDWVIDYEVL
jgi:hypothetical protein